ncbi:hypothetical protein [Arenimonas sp.]|uniref:hypothetical protein n=1 Tax=Arenimonas sp. TaxID=1872635 RepID=UPI0035AEFF20
MALKLAIPHRAAFAASFIALAACIATPAAAREGGTDWRALCVAGNEVELLVGSEWYRGTVTGPDINGEDYCGIRTSAYTGRPMDFAMAPDRMRPVQVPGVAGPDVGPAPKPARPAGATKPAKPAKPAVRAPAAAAVTANLADIGEAYRVNTPAARQRYEGRTVTLTGNLQSVGSDYIRLTDGPFGVAMCSFDEGQRGGLAALQAGSRLTVQGDNTAWGWGTFRLQSCRVIGSDAAAKPAPAPDRRRADGRPPLGRYVCRQSMTTIGYIQLGKESYSVNNVRGGYAVDAASGAIRWKGGAYAGWPARYEFSAAGAGHAHDEHIIRMTDETDRLRIDCFLMAG